MTDHQSPLLLATPTSTGTGTGPPVQSVQVRQLMNLLHHQSPSPTQLEITILPDPKYYVQRHTNTNDNNDNNDINNTSNSNDDDDDDDDSEYYYLKDGIHLGIHAPNVPILARTFRKEYYALRKLFFCVHNNNSSGSSSSISIASSSSSSSSITSSRKELEERLWAAITCLVLLCPDHATAWSDRKRILLLRTTSATNIVNADNNDKNASDTVSTSTKESIIRIWKQEIQFLNLLFTQHSKAPNSWSHRKWISKQLISNLNDNLKINDGNYNNSNNNQKHQKQQQQQQQLSKWTTQELDICTTIAKKYPKNYYAWTHRRFVIDTIILLYLKIQQQQQQQQQQMTQNDTRDMVWSILQSELDFICSTWIIKHVSDHSAIHYGGELLRLIIYMKCRSSSSSSSSRGRSILKKQIHDNERCAYNFCHNFHSRYNDDNNNNNHSILTLSKVVEGMTCDDDIHNVHDKKKKKEDDDNCHDDNNHDRNHEWIMDKIQQLLIKSQELIIDYPSNEVIWIWRRICSQIYFDYLDLVDYVNVNDDDDRNGIKENMDLNLFVQKEIGSFLDDEDVKDTIVSESTTTTPVTITLKDKYDQRRYKLFSTTYILWLVEHLQRRRQRQQQSSRTRQNDKTHSTYIPEESLMVLESKLIHSLGGGEEEGGLLVERGKDQVGFEVRDTATTTVNAAAAARRPCTNLAMSNLWSIKSNN